MHNYIPQSLKCCTKCSIEKPCSDFRVEKRTKIGLQSRCKSCEAEYAKNPNALEKRRVHSEKIRQTPERIAYMLDYTKNQQNIERKRERSTRWAMENPDKVAKTSKAWLEANLDRKRAMNADWNARNRPAKVAALAKYRATKTKATPAWADMRKIKEIYQKASEFGMHVDHVVPLHGKNVCGLHVHNNLQLLSMSENCAKGNKWDSE